MRAAGAQAQGSVSKAPSWGLCPLRVMQASDSTSAKEELWLKPSKRSSVQRSPRSWRSSWQSIWLPETLRTEYRNGAGSSSTPLRSGSKSGYSSVASSRRWRRSAGSRNTLGTGATLGRMPMTVCTKMQGNGISAFT